MNTLLVVGVVIPVTLLFVFALCKAAAKPAPKPDHPSEYDQGSKFLYRLNSHGQTVHALGCACGWCKMGSTRMHEAWSAEREIAYRAAAKSYANGRPTMPSEIEPELEMERRTR